MTYPMVMAGLVRLVLAIHVWLCPGEGRRTWMPATSVDKRGHDESALTPLLSHLANADKIAHDPAHPDFAGLVSPRLAHRRQR